MVYAMIGIVLYRHATARTAAPSNPHNTYVGLQALPEDTLYYPGSVVLDRYGGDPYRGWGSGMEATSGTYLGVNSPRDQVLQFYAMRLRALGWQPGGMTGRLSTEVAVSFYQRDDLLLKIGVMYNSKPDARLPKGALDYMTVYTLEVSYGGGPAPTPMATTR